MIEFPIFDGLVLRAKEHLREWPDETAEIGIYDPRTQKWNICVAGNFSTELTKEEIWRDYELLEHVG